MSGRELYLDYTACPVILTYDDKSTILYTKGEREKSEKNWRAMSTILKEA